MKVKDLKTFLAGCCDEDEIVVYGVNHFYNSAIFSKVILEPYETLPDTWLDTWLDSIPIDPSASVVGILFE